MNTVGNAESAVGKIQNSLVIQSSSRHLSLLLCLALLSFHKLSRRHRRTGLTLVTQHKPPNKDLFTLRPKAHSSSQTAISQSELSQDPR